MTYLNIIIALYIFSLDIREHKLLDWTLYIWAWCALVLSIFIIFDELML